MASKNGSGKVNGGGPAHGWANRIIGSDNVDPTQLLAHPDNFRIHPGGQQNALQGSLDTIGWIQQIIVNRLTGHVVDGHLRVQLAMRNNEPLVPVLYVDLTEAEEAQALMSLDPIAAMAGTDKAKLDELLRMVNTDNEQVQEFLSELAKSNGLDYGAPPPDDPGAEIDRAEELRVKWGVESGQLWSLGDHRVICGDCTDAAVVARVMGGEKADMVFTDPPYNVAIVGGTHDPRDEKNFSKGPRIENDCMSDEEFDESLFLWFSSMALAMSGGAVFYVCAPAGRTETQFRNAIDKVFILRQCIVWAKQNAVFGRQDYHWKHESILYGWKDGAAHYFCDDHTQSTVWEIDRPMRSDKEHPTQKPVELPEKAITNSSTPGDLIYDPFCGSGTTIAACERLGRRGRGIDKDPKYIAVTLERWSQMTGKTPELVTL